MCPGVRAAAQMCRALAHIHAMGVCHRDIKPQNLLVNTHTHQLKLCDFGSAKVGAASARTPARTGSRCCPLHSNPHRLLVGSPGGPRQHSTVLTETGQNLLFQLLHGARTSGARRAASPAALPLGQNRALGGDRQALVVRVPRN